MPASGVFIASPHHTHAGTEVCAVGAERLARVIKNRLTELDLKGRLPPCLVMCASVGDSLAARGPWLAPLPCGLCLPLW